MLVTIASHYWDLKTPHYYGQFALSLGKESPDILISLIQPTLDKHPPDMEAPDMDTFCGL